jgi:hypothetical protein
VALTLSKFGHPCSIQKSVTYSALRIFNALPKDLLQLQNNKALFKSMLRKYLLVNAFYCVDEFLVHSKKSLMLLFSSLFKFIGFIIHVLLISFVIVLLL